MISRALRIGLMLTVLLLPLASPARTATAKERAACEAKIQSQIDSIDSKLRGGYSAAEGERLRERRRKLEEKRAGCRTIP